MQHELLIAPARRSTAEQLEESELWQPCSPETEDDRTKQKEQEQLSPFELKDNLIHLARENQCPRSSYGGGAEGDGR